MALVKLNQKSTPLDLINSLLDDQNCLYFSDRDSLDKQLTDIGFKLYEWQKDDYFFKYIGEVNEQLLLLVFFKDITYNTYKLLQKKYCIMKDNEFISHRIGQPSEIEYCSRSNEIRNLNFLENGKNRESFDKPYSIRLDKNETSYTFSDKKTHIYLWEHTVYNECTIADDYLFYVENLKRIYTLREISTIFEKLKDLTIEDIKYIHNHLTIDEVNLLHMYFI